MKVFLAGGSGAIGNPLIPLLVSYGHHVGATTRHQTKTNDLRLLGAEPVVVDAFDENTGCDSPAGNDGRLRAESGRSRTAVRSVLWTGHAN